MTQKQLRQKIDKILSLNMPIHPEHTIDKRNILNAIMPMFKDEILKARPEKKNTSIEIPDTLHRNIGYNQAIKDWSNALGIGETE